LKKPRYLLALEKLNLVIDQSPENESFDTKVNARVFIKMKQTYRVGKY
jgi:hypothetical protein